MLVSELRNEIKKYDKDKLESIIVELYKRIPKNKKEDYNVDDFIKNPLDNKKTVKKSVSFEQLQKEIVYFLNCVDNEYYVVPNRIIPKKERSSWRFKVKRYYKELNSILPSDDKGALATELLIQIFIRLSIGSNRLLFVNWDTFKALGVSQDDYFDVIMKRILYNGYSADNLKECLDLLERPKDPCELSYNIFRTFIANLKTADNKKTAIELIKERIEVLKTKLKSVKSTDREYEIEEDLNCFVMCVTEIFFSLCEMDKGISFFHKNYIEKNKEVKEYILLELIDEELFKDAWCREYEKHIGKIDYRESLKNKYEQLKNQD